MAELVTDCPRCDTRKISFEALAVIPVGRDGWQSTWEMFCECGHCHRGVTFSLRQRQIDQPGTTDGGAGLLRVRGSINEYVQVLGYISAKDEASISPPDHLPPEVLRAFEEAAKCLAINCYNAAGTMFRLCIDLASRGLLPESNDNGLNHRVRRDLGLRLPWMFDNGLLPGSLRDLSHCVKEDGNDGAHQGNLSEEDALDLLDFTDAFLTRLFTEPERIRLATERRTERRGG